MHFTLEQIEFYWVNDYLAAPRVLSDDELDLLKRRIDDILTGRVPFPQHLLGETTRKSSAKGQLPSVKIVNLFRSSLFAKCSTTA